MRMAGTALAGLLLAALLGLTAAHLPPRMKLVGLFPIFQGLVTGGLLGFAARKSGVLGTRTAKLLIGVCVLTGQGVASAESYRLNVEFWNGHFRSLPLNSTLPDFTPQQLDELPVESREVAEQIIRAKEQRNELRSFPGWVRQRLPATFGDWPPAAFYAWWLGETILATIAGLIVGSRMIDPTRSPPVPPS